MFFETASAIRELARVPTLHIFKEVKTIFILGENDCAYYDTSFDDIFPYWKPATLYLHNKNKNDMRVRF